MMTHRSGWSCDQEGIICLHDDIKTAVVEHIECGNFGPDDTLEVIYWQPVVVDRRVAGSPLDDVLDCLNDEYLPDGFDSEPPTPAMLAAEKAFIDAVLAEYDCKGLERVRSVEVRVGDYMDGSNEQ